MKLLTVDICKVINLGAITWSCYFENYIILRCVIMRLKGSMLWLFLDNFALIR